MLKFHLQNKLTPLISVTISFKFTNNTNEPSKTIGLARFYKNLVLNHLNIIQFCSSMVYFMFSVLA